MKQVDFKLLIHEYKALLSKVNTELDNSVINALKTKENTFRVIFKMVGLFYEINPEVMHIQRRLDKSIQLRDLFSFIAYLYFDYKSKEIADYLHISRGTLHHNCNKVIGKYYIYPSFREKMLMLFSEEEMGKMIVKFSDKKRKV